MNQAQYLVIAEAAGIIPWSHHKFIGANRMSHVDDGLDGDLASLLQFAKLIEEHAVAEEREACAKVCEARNMGDNSREDMEARRCAWAIRSRGQK